MLNDHVNHRIIANIERIISEKNKERASQNFPRIRKKDLTLRSGIPYGDLETALITQI